MSTIGPSTGFDRASLSPHLGGPLGLDDLRRQDGQTLQDAGHKPTQIDSLDLTPAPSERLVDAGEVVLNLSAWQGYDKGERLFAGDPSLEIQLGNLELGPAADLGTDAVLHALA